MGQVTRVNAESPTILCCDSPPLAKLGQRGHWHPPWRAAPAHCQSGIAVTLVVIRGAVGMVPQGWAWPTPPFLGPRLRGRPWCPSGCCLDGPGYLLGNGDWEAIGVWFSTDTQLHTFLSLLSPKHRPTLWDNRKGLSCLERIGVRDKEITTTFNSTSPNWVPVVAFDLGLNPELLLK